MLRSVLHYTLHLPSFEVLFLPLWLINSRNVYFSYVLVLRIFSLFSSYNPQAAVAQQHLNSSVSRHSTWSWCHKPDEEERVDRRQKGNGGWLTSYSAVSLENLIVGQLVKTFPAFYGTWRTSTVFKTKNHWTWSRARWIYSMPSHFFKIYFNIVLESTPMFSMWYLYVRCSRHNPVCISLLSHTHSMPRLSHPSWSANSYNACRRVHIIKLSLRNLSSLLYFPPSFQLFSAAPCCQVFPLIWQTKLHTCTKNKQTFMFIHFNIYVFDSSQVQPVAWSPYRLTIPAAVRS
jgi:hypothetical protein